MPFDISILWRKNNFMKTSFDREIGRELYGLLKI
jgi:hypothetical protein